MSREDSETMLLLGTGNLASYIIKANLSVRSLKKVMVWGRNLEKAKSVIDSVSVEYPDVQFEAIEDREAACAEADIVVAATASHEQAGNIVGVSGFEDVNIGETLSANEESELIDFVEIDPPTVQMQFSVNDSPFAGKEGKYVTSRQIRDRLMRETKTNISIEVNDSDTAGVFNVAARGAMQIAVLVEEMRREGYEVLVSRPMVITKRNDNDVLVEPFETLYVEVPEEYVSGLMKALAARRGDIVNMNTVGSSSMIEALIPTRGLIGFEFELLNMTSGHGIMSHLFKEYGPVAGDIAGRSCGTLVSMETGLSMAYSLDALESRGKLFIGAGENVYEGQIVCLLRHHS